MSDFASDEKFVISISVADYNIIGVLEITVYSSKKPTRMNCKFYNVGAHGSSTCRGDSVVSKKGISKFFGEW